MAHYPWKQGQSDIWVTRVTFHRFPCIPCINQPKYMSRWVGCMPTPWVRIQTHMGEFITKRANHFNNVALINTEGSPSDSFSLVTRKCALVRWRPAEGVAMVVGVLNQGSIDQDGSLLEPTDQLKQQHAEKVGVLMRMSMSLGVTMCMVVVWSTGIT